MRQKLIILAMFVAVAAAAAPAAAITAQQFGCEKAVVVELAKMSRARGKCISQCYGKKQASPGAYTCSPPFDLSTTTCTSASEVKYIDQIVSKCTGNMPSCGGFQRGYCSANTSQTCSNDGGTYGGDCTGITNVCNGRCSTTTSQSCADDPECPLGESCVNDASTKDPMGFAQGNIYDGSPLSIVNQIDLFSEGLFLCRQKVCSDTGAWCTQDGDCPAGTCDAGNCENGSADCDYDGECSSPKKCLARGRCSTTAQACTVGLAGDCPGAETCERYGRCTNSTTPPGRQAICFDNNDCGQCSGDNSVTCDLSAMTDACVGLGAGSCQASAETCQRTVVQTDRKKELLCTQAVNDALAKLTFDIANCEAKCAQDRDQLDGGRCQLDTSIKCKLSNDQCAANGPCKPTSCDHFATGRCADGLQVCADDSDCTLAGTPCSPTSPAPAAQSVLDCRAKALDKARSAINKKCPSLPACGVYSHAGSPVGFQYTADNLLNFVKDAQDGQFKEDNPDVSPGSNFCLP